MEELTIDEYFEKANNNLAVLNDAHSGTWRLGEAERWDADQETGTLTWTFDDGVTVTAPFQIVGTYNTLDSTFLWAWDHPSVVTELTEDAAKVLEFGKEKDIDFLQWRKLNCAEEDAWELTALAVLLNERQGAYRGPAGTTMVFMTFGEVQIKKA